jgi:hypothetical protein
MVNRDISIKFISTHDQIADIFTKGLTSSRFTILGSKLVICSNPIRLKGGVKNISTALETEDQILRNN